MAYLYSSVRPLTSTSEDTGVCPHTGRFGLAVHSHVLTKLRLTLRGLPKEAIRKHKF